MSTVSPRLLAVAALSFVAAVVWLLLLTRPRPAPVVAPGTHIEHHEGELPAAHDDTGHYAPGSPQAVAETFLRLWWRAHYEDAQVLATGVMRERCRINLQKTLAEAPDERETMREVQLIAEAAQFDLERATVTDLPAGDGGVPRKEVHGVIHAHGPTPDGHPVESRREQTLVMELVNGGWRVASWTPSRTEGEVRIQ